MRHAFSWLLLLGMAAPAFVGAAGPDASTTDSSAPSLSTPPSGLLGGDSSGAPSTSSPKPETKELKDTKKDDVKPDLGLGGDSATAPADMDESKPAESKEEECKPKKKKRRKKKTARRAKSHNRRSHCGTYRSCGGMVDEAYRAQNSMYMSKECVAAPVAVSCDQNSSCGTSPSTESKDSK